MATNYNSTAADLKEIFNRAKGKQLESIKKMNERLKDQPPVISLMPENVDKLMYSNAFDSFFRNCHTEV